VAINRHRPLPTVEAYIIAWVADSARARLAGSRCHLGALVIVRVLGGTGHRGARSTTPSRSASIALGTKARRDWVARAKRLTSSDSANAN
jgi:hypothetical protein